MCAASISGGPFSCLSSARELAVWPQIRRPERAQAVTVPTRVGVHAHAHALVSTLYVRDTYMTQLPASQIHLAHGHSSATQMTVSWMTAASTPTMVLFDTLLDFSSPRASLGCVGACGTAAARAVRQPSHPSCIATEVYASSYRDQSRLVISCCARAGSLAAHATRRCFESHICLEPRMPFLWRACNCTGAVANAACKAQGSAHTPTNATAPGK